MKLQIRHDTTYRCRRDVTLYPHQLMLPPRGMHDLRVLASWLHLTPEAKIAWTQDVFGNLVATADYRRGHPRALAQRVEVGTGEVWIIGSKSNLPRLLAANSEGTAVAEVPSIIPKWRSGRLPQIVTK